MRILWSLALLLLLIVACEGKTGPAGSAGESNGSKVTILTGVLNYQEVGYWVITITGGNLADVAISVHVRRGSNDPWFEPEWIFIDNYISILDDDRVAPGYEYRITITDTE